MAAVEVELVLSSEESKSFSGLSLEDRKVVLAKIKQGQRLAQTLAPFSDEKRNVPVAITQEVQQGPVQTAQETRSVQLYTLRRAAADADATLCSYGFEHAARTIFQSPSQTNNAV